MLYFALPNVSAILCFLNSHASNQCPAVSKESERMILISNPSAGYKIRLTGQDTNQYDPSAMPKITCNKQGKVVDLSLPRRLEICKVPLTLKNGAIASSRPNDDAVVLQNDVLTHSCNTGFGLVGAVQLTCESTGNFDNASPVCKKICPVPLTPANGAFTSSGATVLQVLEFDELTFSCDSGYQIEGAAKLTCLSNGNFDLSTPLCKHIPGFKGFIITAGGMSQGKDVANCYAYDISIATWLALPNLSSARHGGGLVAHNGSVFHAAGHNPFQGISDFVRLSTQENRWFTEASTTLVNYAGVNLLSTNDSMFILGGKSRYVEKYTIAVGVWQQVASTKVIHYVSGAAVLHDKLYVCGSSRTPSKICEVYNSSTNIWEYTTSMNTARKYLAMVAMKGQLYVFGGAEGHNEKYDPINDKWTYISRTDLSFGYHNNAVATDGNNIYIIGHETSVGHKEVMEYSPEQDSWRRIADYPLEIYQTSATFVQVLP